MWETLGDPSDGLLAFSLREDRTDRSLAGCFDLSEAAGRFAAAFSFIFLGDFLLLLDVSGLGSATLGTCTSVPRADQSTLASFDACFSAPGMRFRLVDSGARTRSLRRKSFRRISSLFGGLVEYEVQPPRDKRMTTVLRRPVMRDTLGNKLSERDAVTKRNDATKQVRLVRAGYRSELAVIQME